MDLNEIAIFIKVVKTHSFSGAAKALRLPNSTVSAKIASLENHVGVTLIERTTRKLKVTDAGELFFNRCLKGIHEIEAAESELQKALREPQGTLRVTAPVELGHFVLAPILPSFFKQFPKIKLEIILSNNFLDLMKDDIDVALRTGPLKDSSYLSQNVGTIQFSLYAQNGLSGTDRINHPEDLRHQPCLIFSPHGPEWRLFRDEEEIELCLQNKIMVNDLNLLKSLTVGGIGISVMPDFFCKEEVRMGILKKILPEWKTKAKSLHFLYPSHRQGNSKLSAFLNYSAEAVRGIMNGPV